MHRAHPDFSDAVIPDGTRADVLAVPYLTPKPTAFSTAPSLDKNAKNAKFLGKWGKRKLTKTGKNLAEEKSVERKSDSVERTEDDDDKGVYYDTINHVLENVGEVERALSDNPEESKTAAEDITETSKMSVAKRKKETYTELSVWTKENSHIFR